MSSVLPPIHRAGWPFIAAFLAVSAAARLAVGAAVLAGPARHRLVRLLLSRSGPRDARRPGADREPGRRRGGGDRRARAAARARARRAAAALHRHLHERVRRAREPHAGCRARSCGVAYHAGKFLNASFDKASDENERQSFKIRTAERPRDRAGPDRRPGGAADRRLRRGGCQRWRPGQRVGLIRFGSRCDVYLPRGRRAAGPGRPAHAGRRDRARRSVRQPTQAPGTRRLMMLRHRHRRVRLSALQAAPPGPQHAHHPGPVRRDDLDPLRARRPLRAGGDADRCRRRARRAGRALGADAEPDQQARRRARQPRRLPELRRGAGDPGLPVDAARRARRRLGGGDAVRDLLRLAPRPLQHRARSARPAALDALLLHRHPGTCRGGPGAHAADRSRSWSATAGRAAGS